MQGVRDFIKYIKRGYTRPTHLVAIDLRNGRITKEEAQAMIREYEGRRPPSLDLFLEYVGLTEEEFIPLLFLIKCLLGNLTLNHFVQAIQHPISLTGCGVTVSTLPTPKSNAPTALLLGVVYPDDSALRSCYRCWSR